MPRLFTALRTEQARQASAAHRSEGAFFWLALNLGGRLEAVRVPGGGWAGTVGALASGALWDGTCWCASGCGLAETGALPSHLSSRGDMETCGLLWPLSVPAGALGVALSTGSGPVSIVVATTGPEVGTWPPPARVTSAGQDHSSSVGPTGSWVYMSKGCAALLISGWRVGEAGCCSPTTASLT